MQVDPLSWRGGAFPPGLTWFPHSPRESFRCKSKEMMAFMGPMLPSSGSFSIKLVDNDHHDELRTLHSDRGRGGGKTRAMTALACVTDKIWGIQKKILRL